MYFPDEPLNACDRLLNATLRPDLLIATPVSSQGGPGRMLNFDICSCAGIGRQDRSMSVANVATTRFAPEMAVPKNQLLTGAQLERPRPIQRERRLG
ncbi:hypothetical protein [Bradyrhizobium sp. MOS002]|uniref:hypothetical protein n=1 Tax=Bradyrhizobium sp. MOS002 TaxID=2133947 RepID=UPI0035A09897